MAIRGSPLFHFHWNYRLQMVSVVKNILKVLWSSLLYFVVGFHKFWKKFSSVTETQKLSLAKKNCKITANPQTINSVRTFTTLIIVVRIKCTPIAPLFSDWFTFNIVFICEITVNKGKIKCMKMICVGRAFYVFDQKSIKSITTTCSLINGF